MEAMAYVSVLRERLGNDGFDALKEMMSASQANLLTIERFETRLTSEFAQLKSELRGEMQQLRADIRIDIADRSAELMKWAMLFWVAQAATIAGIFAALR
jgi:hypothetical protein